MAGDVSPKPLGEPDMEEDLYCDECGELCVANRDMTDTLYSECCAAPVSDEPPERYRPGLYDPQVDSDKY